MIKYSDNALAIYKRLYFDPTTNETKPEETHDRVANFISLNEKEYILFLEILNKKQFRPNSPCLINAGRNNEKNAHDKQLCACFILGLEDTMESIIDMWGICAKIYASGAGAGIPITNLREFNSPISTGGVASGPLNYLKVIDLLSDTVRSGGRHRRAANIGVAKFNHPDIIEIIESKSGKNSLSSFNLSISVTDEFMNNLFDDYTINLVSPNKNKKVKDINNHTLWDNIIVNAWECGDPGLLFVDKANKFNPFPSYGEILSTNPCVHGNTLVLTDKGYYKIQELNNKYVKVWNGFEFSKVTVKTTGYNQPMLTITFSDGSELTCTKYHKFYLNNNSIVEAQNLSIGDKLEKWNYPTIDSLPIFNEDDELPDSYTQGFFSGDGFIDRGKNIPTITLYGEKIKLIPHLNLKGIHKYNEEYDKQRVIPVETIDKYFVPINKYSLQYKLKWFAGLCDSDGTITKDGCIQISNTNFEFLQDVKLMLNTMGVTGTLNISHLEQKKELPNGKNDKKEYNCKHCYRISISAFSVKHLINIGLIAHRLDLSAVNPNRDASRFIQVTDIEDNNEICEKVYCFEEPRRHKGCFNGIVTGQCGEVPLLPWSVCNIGSINLNTCIINEYFGWDIFEEIIRISVRFLDNVIDKTSYLHPNFEKMCKKTRPIGLGLMGFADILIKLGIPYGSEESIKFFEKICFFMNKIAIDESINMVIDGKKPINIPDEDKDHFYELIGYYSNYNPDIFTKYNKHGIRNSNWTCIAPTGSISMSADCSYAWEPLMALVWEKPLTDSDDVLKIVHPQFEKDLNLWLNDNLTHNKKSVLNDIICNHGSIQKLDYLPQDMKDLYKVAHDIDPMTKIKMQGAGQKWISLAISSTCNLPNSATIEDVDKIYRYAYECGLKGITIFRDGCLDKQIVNFGKVKNKNLNPKEKAIELKSEIEKRNLDIVNAKRPIKRSGDTIEIKTPHGNLFVTCNKYNEKPIEIFYRVGKQGTLANVLIDALGRVCSKALQNNVPIETIIDTLRGLKGEKFWFKIDDLATKNVGAESIVDAIAQIMEYHWTDQPKENECQENILEREECPQCYRKTLRRDAGCRGGVCMACGYSNCG